MHEVLLYDNKLDLGTGQFASVAGYKLVSSGHNECPEAIISEDDKIYGYIYQVDDDMLALLDTYYGTGIELHNRTTVVAQLEGGSFINVYMYEFNMELV